MSQSPMLVVKQFTIDPDCYRVELALTRAGQPKRSASAEGDDHETT